MTEKIKMKDYLAELQNCKKCNSYSLAIDLSEEICQACLIPDEDLPPPITEEMFQESFWNTKLEPKGGIQLRSWEL